MTASRPHPRPVMSHAHHLAREEAKDALLLLVEVVVEGLGGIGFNAAPPSPSRFASRSRRSIGDIPSPNSPPSFSMSSPTAAVVALPAILTAAAFAAQDRYSLQVPGGLAFAEFKGYEDWQVIAVSHNGDKIALIVGNPAMIEAYKAAIPGNGKPFPDGRQDGEDPLDSEEG